MDSKECRDRYIPGQDTIETWKAHERRLKFLHGTLVLGLFHTKGGGEIEIDLDYGFEEWCSLLDRLQEDDFHE